MADLLPPPSRGPGPHLPPDLGYGAGKGQVTAAPDDLSSTVAADMAALRRVLELRGEVAKLHGLLGAIGDGARLGAAGDMRLPGQQFMAFPASSTVPRMDNDLHFTAHTVDIDNLTNLYVWVPALACYIPPGAILGRYTIPNGAVRAQALYQAPPPVVQAAAITTQSCLFTWSEERLRPETPVQAGSSSFTPPGAGSATTTTLTAGIIIDSVSSAAYEASHVLKASPGTLYGYFGYNSLNASQWIQVHDATSLPADTAVPEYTQTVGPLSNFSLDLGLIGDSFTVGVVICNSTTGPTKTLGAANCWFTGLVV